MKLKLKRLNLATGGPLIAVINSKTAKKLDLFPGDRIHIKRLHKKDGIYCVIDVSNKGLNENEIALFEEGFKKLEVEEKTELEVAIVEKPVSTFYIKKKLEGQELNEQEINTIVKDIVNNELSEVELTYFVSACYTKGLSIKEIVDLTNSIVKNGEHLTFKKGEIILDKHCAGGIAGNRTTMIVVPILASLGYKMPKTSSRAITSASVTYDTPLLIIENKKMKIISAGKFIDPFFEKKSHHIIKIGKDGEYLEINKEELKVPAFNKYFKIKNQKITGVFRHKAKGKKILKIKLVTGREVSITEDHSLFTLNNGEIIPLEAGELKEGTIILVPRELEITEKITKINLISELLQKLPKKELENIFIEGLNKELFKKDLLNQSSKEHMRFYRGLISLKLLKEKNIRIPKDALLRHGDSKFKIPIKLKITPELGRLLGYFAAEGHCIKHRVEFYIGTHEKEFLKDLQYCIKKVFGIKAKYKIRNTKPTETDVFIPTKFASILFRDIFETGNMAELKKVPTLILNSNINIQKEFLKAYFIGDGNERTGKHTGLAASTISPDLINDLQYLLALTNTAYSTRTKDNCIREFETYTSNCAPSYQIYTQKKQLTYPSMASINQVPIIESGIINLIQKNILLNNPANRSKLKSILLNQDTISFKNLKKYTLHLQNQNNPIIKELIKIKNGNLGFLRVKEIKEITYDKPFVYDLCIKGYENFVGGNGAICLHNSGTADTMEVLAPVTLNKKKLMKIIRKTNACIAWGGGVDLASADDKMIRIRHPLSIDPTGMLLASILAKKKAAGATHILIDIPYGVGAKIETKPAAKNLRKLFLKVGKKLGLKLKVILTDGTQPIGNGIGPALEAEDVLSVLKGDGPNDLREKSIYLATELLKLAGAKHPEEKVLTAIESGDAYKKMIEIIRAQGGKKNPIIPKAKYYLNVNATHDGTITEINNKKISKIATLAGAPEDKAAGIYLRVRKNRTITKGTTMFTIYSNSSQNLDFIKKQFKDLDPIIY